MQGLEAKALPAGMVTFFLNWCDYCYDGGRLVPWGNGKLLTGGHRYELRSGD